MLESIADIALVLEAVAAAVLVIAAVRTLARGRTTPPARWLFAAMLTGMLGVFGVLLLEAGAPYELADAEPGGVIANVCFVLLPALVYRFGREYHHVDRAVDAGVASVVALLVALSLSMPMFARATAPQAWWHDATQVLIAIEALLLTGFVAILLHRDARDVRSPVVRARMGLLALAIGLLLVAYALGALRGDLADALLGVAGTAAALLALMSFAPTPAMRSRWRRRLHPQIEAIVLRLMVAAESRDVTDVALPMIVDVCGARRVTLRDVEGHEIASSLSGGEQREAVFEATRARGARSYEVAFPFGTIEVETDAYTPVFGDDEAHLVHVLGAYAGLALERCAMLEQR